MDRCWIDDLSDVSNGSFKSHHDTHCTDVKVLNDRNMTHAFTACLISWLHVKQDIEIISKLFQNNFISHVTTSETEIKLFQPLTEF